MVLLQLWMCQRLGPVDGCPVKGRLSAPLPTATMRFFPSIVTWGAIPVIGLLALTAVAQAQTLNGIRIGEEISAASRMAGKSTFRVAAGPHEEVRWRLPDGNKLALATDPGNGRIAYAEETWGGRPDGKPADFPGFIYGETTLADIRMHAENNGFAFVERLIDERPDGLRLFNSYEVEGSPGLVVTFVTRCPRRIPYDSRASRRGSTSTGPPNWTASSSGIRATSSRSGVKPSARAGTTNPYAGPPPARWHWIWQLPSKRRTGLLGMFRPQGRVRGRQEGDSSLQIIALGSNIPERGLQPWR